jgi:hypothetical protein
MKRIIALLLAGMVLFTGCSNTLGGRLKPVNYKDVMDSLVERINKGDADGIVSMFSEETKGEVETLPEDAQALIDLFQGNEITYEHIGGSEGSSSKSHSTTIKWSFHVYAGDTTYIMSWKYVEENMEDPQKVGFNRISIQKESDFDTEHMVGVEIPGITIITPDNHYDLHVKEAELQGEVYDPNKVVEYRYDYLMSWGQIFYPEWEENDATAKFKEALDNADGWRINVDTVNNKKDSISGKLPVDLSVECTQMDVQFGDIVVDENNNLYIFYDDASGVFAKLGNIEKDYTSSQPKVDAINRMMTSDDLLVSFEMIREVVED